MLNVFLRDLKVRLVEKKYVSISKLGGDFEIKREFSEIGLKKLAVNYMFFYSYMASFFSLPNTFLHIVILLLKEMKCQKNSGQLV